MSGAGDVSIGDDRFFVKGRVDAFWVDAEAAQNARGQPELGDVIVTRADAPWRAMGSAVATEQPWGDFLASVASGLTRCGGSMSGSRDRRDMTTWHKVCLTC